MKHYKARCSVHKDNESIEVFIEIYCSGNSFIHALQNARSTLERDYPMDIDHFDFIALSFQWEDEE